MGTNIPQATPARCHGKAQPQLCGARPCDLLTGIPALGSSGNATGEPRSGWWVRKRGWQLTWQLLHEVTHVPSGLCDTQH